MQNTVKNGGGEIDENKVVSGETLDVSDYLVGKVLYTEKKVLEALNKLHYIRDTLLNPKVKAVAG